MVLDYIIAQHVNHLQHQKVKMYQLSKLDRLHEIYVNLIKQRWYVYDFIEDMKKVFPTLKDDWGIYVPEVKYLSPEPLVDYTNLALTKYQQCPFRRRCFIS